MSERTLSELVTHSPANLHRAKASAKGKPSRLKPQSKPSKSAVKEETPEMSETEADSLDITESVGTRDGTDSPSAALSARTLSRAAKIPFPGHYYDLSPGIMTFERVSRNVKAKEWYWKFQEFWVPMLSFIACLMITFGLERASSSSFLWQLC